MKESIINNHADFIWSVADLLRDDYKQSEYGKVILPLTVLRWLDCVLEPTKDAVLEYTKKLQGRVENMEPTLFARVASRSLHEGLSPLQHSGMVEPAMDWLVALGYPLTPATQHLTILADGERWLLDRHTVKGI